ncbi:MAG: fluoride efflux transporter CrcB [Gammaproteobacteria bacterium]
MTQLLAIAAGGAIGAVLRYWLSTAIQSRTASAFPYGTLTVNVVGSLLIGFLYIWLTERMVVGPAGRAFVLIGVLGAFTTFSTFSIETLNLMESGQPGKALVNVLASVIVCVSAAAAGVLAARQL